MVIGFIGALQPLHWVIVLIIVLIIFGPGKLPQVGKSIGKAINEFRRSTNVNNDDEDKKDKPA
ncbi:MAG: twin-arginine translocase TatA/TatE family subunit [Firmicutes bacterium]|nr:twin-arginine translocase TatA/TatE family subunit [Bacillota bacterium]